MQCLTSCCKQVGYFLSLMKQIPPTVCCLPSVSSSASSSITIVDVYFCSLKGDLFSGLGGSLHPYISVQRRIIISTLMVIPSYDWLLFTLNLKWCDFPSTSEITILRYNSSKVSFNYLLITNRVVE